MRPKMTNAAAVSFQSFEVLLRHLPPPATKEAADRLLSGCPRPSELRDHLVSNGDTVRIMMKTRSVLAVVSLLFAAVLTACGSDSDLVDKDSSSAASDDKTTDAPKKEQGAIIESGFGQEDGDEYVQVVALVENKSDHGGQTVTVNYNLKDASGKIVASASQVESFTGPGQQVAVQTQVSVDKGVKVASMDATLLVEDEDTFSTSDVTFEPAVAQVKKDEYGGVTARYAVKNPTADPLKDLRIGVICKDKAGKVIGGGIEFPELVPPSGEILADTDVNTSGVPASCTAYISPGGM